MDKNSLTLLILNGKGAGNEDLRVAINKLRDEGFNIAVRVTWEKGDGQRYLDEAMTLQAETVVAGGGDGTINEIATALAFQQRWKRRYGWRFRVKPARSIWRESISSAISSIWQPVVLAHGLRPKRRRS